jgi:hypothetical protein
MRRFLAFFLLLTLSFSSVAMPVFTHVCYGMDKTWSSLFVPPSACCAASERNAEKCKAISTESQDCQLSKLPCCEDAVSLAALDANFTFHPASSLSLLSIVAPPISLFYPIWIGYSLHADVQPHRFDHFPIPRYGRSLLIFEQLFLC